VKLLSYNVLEGALPDRLQAALRVIESANADVIALQEARHWRKRRQEVFRRVRRALGMRGVLAKANSGFDIAVFSRLPVVGYVNYGLETVFLHTAVSVDVRSARGQVVTIFVAHLRPDQPSRRREAELLLKWMRPYRARYCALCGDLNSLMAGDPVARARLWSGSELHRGPQGVIAAIEREGWTDCFRRLNPRAPGFTLGAGRRVARVDYIFASPPLAERLVGCQVLRHPEARAASDHSPVWAAFDI